MLLTGRRLPSHGSVVRSDSGVTPATEEGRGSVVSNPVVMVTGEEAGRDVLVLGSAKTGNTWEDMQCLCKYVLKLVFYILVNVVFIKNVSK